MSHATRLWKVTGTGRSGKPAQLTVNAPDHAAALKLAESRRVNVESCVLVLVSTLPPASVLGRQVCEPQPPPRGALE